MNDVFENVKKQVSNWCKLKRIIALVLIYLRRLLLKVHRKKGIVEMTASYDILPDTLSFPDLNSVQMAESLIIRSSQRKYFSIELKILGEKGIFNRKTSIYKLDPFLDRCGLLGVGGRSSGFWIINCNAAVRSYISKCVTCRHLRGNFQHKKWHRSQVIGCVRNLLLHIAV